MAGEKEKSLILWLSEIGIEDVPLVGGKNASLGEMYQKLDKNGIKIPRIVLSVCSLHVRKQVTGR